MVIEEIIAANGAAIILLIVLLISRYMTRRYTKKEDQIFIILATIGIFASILETICFLVDGKEGAFFHVMNVLTNSLLYLCTASMSIVWLWYADLHINRKHQGLALYLPFFITWALLVIGLIFNIFFEFFFSFGDNNVYAREPLGYIFYAMLIASFIITIIMHVRAKIYRGQSLIFPIYMFLIPVIAACVLQVFFYGLSFAWLGCAIGLMGIYINMLSKYSLVDNLTNLYNRAYIEHKLTVARHSKRYIYSGIMLDIDYFKEINDEFGHSVGDQALNNAANIIINSMDKDTIACRFAGDEFIVLVRVPSNKAIELEAKTKEVEERIRQESEIFNNQNKKPYKIIFSMGHSIYNPNYDDDVFFHSMDVSMYKEKQNHHKLANN